MKNLFVIILLFPICFEGLLAQETQSDKMQTDSLKNYTKKTSADEIVGYKTQTQEQISGSVFTIQNNQLITIPEGNIIKQMQGLVPGLTVIGSGQPGETPKCYIRGIGSFSGSTPLFIVDGVPFDDISLLNPNDVGSVAVLKDASSAAIYGGRAINGVIVINTKQGNQGVHIQYNTSLGWQFPGKGTADQMLTTKEQADLQWLVYKNDRTTESNPLYGLSSNASPTLPPWAANTDWYDAVTNRAALQNHDLSISAGSENAKVYLGAGSFDQNGIIINTNTKRYSVRLNSEFTFFKKHFKIGENINFANRSGRYVSNLDEKSPILAGPYRSQSIIPVYITEPVQGLVHNFQPGEFGGTGMASRLGNSTNVVADRIRDKDDNNTEQQLAGNVYTDIMVFKGLTWRTSFGGTWRKNRATDYTYATYENSENILTSSVSESNSELKSWIATSLLSFNRSFGRHDISALAGFELLQTGEVKFESISKRVESGSLISNSGLNYHTGNIQSLFVNADYSFNNKYLFDFTVRKDNGEVHNSDIYPALSLGWILSKESFMNNVGWLNYLKLRASYGKTGSIYSGIEFVPVINSPGSVSRLKDFELTTNLGFDSRLFNNHVGFVFDWFNRDSRDLYLSLELPGTAGNFGSTHTYARMKNSGIDAALNFNQSFGPFRLNANMNISIYHNEIGKGKYTFFDAGFTRIGTLVRDQPGNPISSFFGYKVEGLFNGPGEVTSAPNQQGAQPGFFRYANLNRDTLIDPHDRTFLGNPHPDFTIGFNLELSYKKFDISTLLYWSQGNEIYNFTKWWTDFWPSFNGQKSKLLLYDSWTPSNENTTVPKATNTSSFSTNTQSTSYYVEDGSYLRMKSLQLGYTFDGKILDKVRISSLRLYLQAVNLFTLTKYSGLDPEIGGQDAAFGIDNGNYPSVRQVIFGLQLGI
jgi:TonB-dependent starch-binding outer membrane protein SusC